MPPSPRKRVLQPAIIALWVVSVAYVITYSLRSCSHISSIIKHTSSIYLPSVATTYAAPVPTPPYQHENSLFSQRICHRNTSTDDKNAPAAVGGSAAAPTVSQLLDTFEGQWGPESCIVLRNACMDEGNFVTFGDSPYPSVNSSFSYGARSSSSSSSSSTPNKGTPPTATSSSSPSSTSGYQRQQPPWLQFKGIRQKHLSFRGFSDVAGTIEYPPPIIRPGGPYEESPDLRGSQIFSNCVAPVILYLNHLYMFGDWWVRSMPTFMHALAAGAWDKRYHIVIATGGQQLDRWQKLVLQSLTDHPVVTLSAASSRALAAQHDTAQHSVPQHAAARPTAAAPVTDKGGAAAFGASKQQQQQQRQQQQRNIQQRQQQGHTARAVPVTSYGRCFEHLTVCSVSDAKRFKASASQQTSSSSSNRASSSSSNRASSIVSRQTWSGAQYVKLYYMQRYGQQYHGLPQQYSRLAEPGAFRVVFAVRARTAAAEGAASSSSRVPANPSDQQLAESVRQLLNIHELLDWCNTWQPITAATSTDLEGVNRSSTAAAAAGGSGGQQRYSHTVCIAHEFGRHASGDGPDETPWGDPDLDPRGLMTDFAVADNADVLVGLHGAQLYNALFMPAHKALVEVRPYGFFGAWPQVYFENSLVKVDKADSILWFGINTVNSSNSQLGQWERQGLGLEAIYARDRHTRVEPAALETLFRRILWAAEEPAAYKELRKAGLTHTTDTLQSAEQYHATLQKSQAAVAAAATAAQQAQQQHLHRPEVAAPVTTAKDVG